jgi:hypothetical protein
MSEELQPGAALDERIAREVMGWKLPGEIGCEYVYGGKAWCRFTDIWVNTPYDHDPEYMNWRHFAPSTNDAHAMMVVDELIRIDPMIRFDLTFFCESVPDRWITTVHNCHTDQWIDARASTRAHAICLMALAAVEAMREA